MDIQDTSDGYHTFRELYEHRHSLLGAFINVFGGWKSKLHHDGSHMEGWFIAGTELPSGMITYHLPERLWSAFPAEELEFAPEWDGHTAEDTVERLQDFWSYDVVE